MYGQRLFAMRVGDAVKNIASNWGGGGGGGLAGSGDVKQNRA
jgi:hypothetical protein